jgi:hypothetical protein
VVKPRQKFLASRDRGWGQERTEATHEWTAGSHQHVQGKAPIAKSHGIDRAKVMIKHQAVGVETLTSGNVFGTPTRTLDFTWASRGGLRVAK